MPKKIQQWSYGEPDVLELVDVPRPDPAALAPGEALVRVLAAGVNPVDAQTRRGGAVAGLMGGFPFTVGWDVAGVVEAIVAGSAVGQSPLVVGDRVLAFPRFPQQAATYAEYVVIDLDDLVPVPPNMSDRAAGGMPLAGLTAWQDLVDIADVRPGQRVLVQGGGGGVGHLAVQIAHHLGAYVIATASTSKQDWLKQLGADEVIDYMKDDVVEILRSTPVDVVLDTVSGPLGVSSVAVTKPGGVVIELLGVSEQTQAAADAAGVRAIYRAVHPDPDQLRRLVAMIAAGDLLVEVGEVFPLEKAADAHRAVESGHSRGNVVLRP